MLLVGALNGYDKPLPLSFEHVNSFLDITVLVALAFLSFIAKETYNLMVILLAASSIFSGS